MLVGERTIVCITFRLADQVMANKSEAVFAFVT